MSKIDFMGRVAVITGVGGGLGRNYAVELARRGAKVVVNDLGGSRDGVGASKSAADRVVDEIKALGGEAVSNYDSVATPEGGENITRTGIDAFGKVDILVNNAGIILDSTFAKMDEKK
jgi:NAD(P)-dependent dehydrogenase (short-subunit alcohol dehydrogenase family)